MNILDDLLARVHDDAAVRSVHTPLIRWRRALA